jgi:hypothetical protein
MTSPGRVMRHFKTDHEIWDDTAGEHAAGRHAGETARRGFVGELGFGCDWCMDEELAAEERAAQLLATIRTYDVGYLRHFAARVIQDAFAEANAEHWERRASVVEDARPRPGDYTGRATPDQLKERHRMLTDLAATYRARSQEAGA